MSVSQLENTQINSHVLNKDTQLEHIIVQFGNEYIKPKKKKRHTYCVCSCVCVYTQMKDHNFCFPISMLLFRYGDSLHFQGSQICTLVLASSRKSQFCFSHGSCLYFDAYLRILYCRNVIGCLHKVS